MTVARTATPRKPIPTPAEAGTTAALLETIRTALDDDGSFVEPGSIDSQGLTVIAGPYRFRLELSEPELMDWDRYSAMHINRDRDYTRQRAADRLDAIVGAELEIDRDWMSETDMPF